LAYRVAMERRYSQQLAAEALEPGGPRFGGNPYTRRPAFAAIPLRQDSENVRNLNDFFSVVCTLCHQAPKRRNPGATRVIQRPVCSAPSTLPQAYNERMISIRIDQKLAKLVFDAFGLFDLTIESQVVGEMKL
jgi:hypothetical protein